VDGKTYRFQSSTSYTVGEKLAVLYKRGNPSKVFIQDFYGAWGGDSFMIIIGIALLLVAGRMIKGIGGRHT
jgi:hypothetical protein